MSIIALTKYSSHFIIFMYAFMNFADLRVFMNIGVVLSGGMAKGAYQLGALKALKEFIPIEDIKYVSGASVGVLNGYAFSTDNLGKLEEVWHNLCTEDNSRMFISTLLRSSLLQRSITNLYDTEKPLKTYFYTSLLDTTNKNIVYKNLAHIDHSFVPDYLRASVSMPIYNRAVNINGISYYDGAVIDNIPVFPLLKHKLDYIICFYFDNVCYKFENPYFDNKIIKITFDAQSTVRQSLVFEKNSIEQMIQAGYEKTHMVLSALLSRGIDDCEYIYRAIERYNRKNRKNDDLRITGDVIVTNLNKITQKLTRKKIL